MVLFKEKLKAVRDFLLKYYTWVFPLLLVVIAAVVVVIALNARSARNAELESSESAEIQESEIVESSIPAEEVPMIQNKDEEIIAIVTEYYNAMGDGDTEKMLTLCDEISENDQLYYAELSKYIDHYSDIEVFSKQGPAENSVVAYVYFKMGIVNYAEVPGYETLYICTDESGRQYIKNESNFTDSEKEYIITLNEQVDVVEFNNRVAVEYNNLMSASPELLEYLGILGEQVKASVGEILAEQNAGSVVPDPVEGGDNTDGEVTSVPGDNAQPVPQYATAKATVNVRASDSEKADKLGKAAKGQRLEVQEVRVNGWTKVVFEGKDGFIRSDLLKLEETAAGFDTIGTVTATTNINVRTAGSETSDRIGMVTAGETLELIEVVDGWCKVKYNTQVGFVKADYVTQQLNE